MFGSLLELFREIFFFAAYVSGGNSFPEPLSQEDERKYLELYAQGDENARSTLIEHNLRLVAHICKKYASANRSNDDMISIGTIGLIKAVSTFKIDRDTALATYAARCIENAILTQWCFRALKENMMYLIWQMPRSILLPAPQVQALRHRNSDLLFS